MPRETDYIEIENATLMNSTESAGLFVIDGREHWLPWSRLDEGGIDKDGQTGTIYVAEWLAEKQEL